MPYRFDIVANIVTTLAAINTPTYRTTTPTVERGIRTWDEVNERQRPYIGVAPDGEEPYRNEVNGVYDVTLRVAIAMHVDGSDETTRATNLDALIDDIIGALSADQTRGGSAISTLIRSVTTDEGDPARVPHGTAVMRVEVNYQRRFTTTP